MIVELRDAVGHRIGGKAAGLARLEQLGLPVPPAVVVPIGAELDDPGEVTRRLGEPLAVRSSALDEDATERSAAGQYETVLDVRHETLADAVAHVRATTQRARAYGAKAEVAVILQRQIPATKAGVVFTRDPLTGEEVHVVECAFGRGDDVVSGNVTPDRYRIRNGHIRARVAGALRTLRDDELGRLLDLVREAEAGFGLPIDVEFCFERTKIWLLQARPITA